MRKKFFKPFVVLIGNDIIYNFVSQYEKTIKERRKLLRQDYTDGEFTINSKID
jgi:hypothetical protein